MTVETLPGIRTMRLRVVLWVAVALGTCTTSCGGQASSSSSPAVAAATLSASPSIDSTTAYRRVLEQGNALLNSDTGSFDPSRNFGLAPYKDSCRQWALMDVALVNQFLGLLSNAQVPTADTSNDQLLRRGLQLSVADDTAVADAIASGNEAAATSALGKTQTDSCTAVVPVMHELDPSVLKPPGC